MGHIPSTGKDKATFLFTCTHNGSDLPFLQNQGHAPLHTQSKGNPPFFHTKSQNHLPLHQKRKALPKQEVHNSWQQKRKATLPSTKTQGPPTLLQSRKGTVLVCTKKRRKGHIPVQKAWANPFFTDKDEHLPPLLITNRPPIRYGKGIRTPLHPFTRGRPSPDARINHTLGTVELSDSKGPNVGFRGVHREIRQLALVDSKSVGLSDLAFVFAIFVSP